MPPKKSNTAVAKKATPATRVAPKRTASKKIEMPAAKKAEAPAAKKAAPKKAPAKTAAEAESEEEEEDSPAPAKKSATKKTTTSTAAPKVQEKPNTKRKRTAQQVEQQDEAPAAKKGKRSASASKRAHQEDDNAEEPAPKKAKQTAKSAATKTSKPAAAKASKRGRIEDDEVEEPAPKKAKKVTKAATPPARKVAAPKAAKPKKAAPPRKVINTAPDQPLEVFVFGEGGAGELGLGHRRVDGKKPLGVRRPRLNPNLQNCVEVYTAAMHGIALTQDNKVKTWGVNDGDALGRNTSVDANNEPEDSEDPDDSGLNPFESVPTEIDMKNVEPGTVFTQVVATDSASFALTEDGQVYACGEFRNLGGAVFFLPGVPKNKPKPGEKRKHMPPVLLPWLKKVTKLATGDNHVLAIEGKTVKAWGNGESFELARRLVERHADSGLIPQSVGLPRGVNPVKIAAGASHNFVLDDKNRLWGWGLNNYNQLGLDLAPEELIDSPSIQKPTLITLLEPYKIVDIDGGNHFTVACTDDGRVLTWGRVESRQCGLPDEMLTEASGVIFSEGKAKVAMPTVVPGLKDIVKVSAGPEHAVVIAKDGKAYSWGFSDNYQTGQGETDAIEEPEHVDNSAVRNVKLIWAGCGAQWSAVAAAVKPAAPPPPVFLFGAAAAAPAATTTTTTTTTTTGSGPAAFGAAAGSGTAAVGATTAGNSTA